MLGNFQVNSFKDRASYEIKASIEEHLNDTGRGDLILIHYAGHGKLDRLGNLCLVTADTRSTSLHSTSIPARQLRDMVANSDCDSVVLLLDCCYSGAATGHRGDVQSQLKLLEDAGGLFVLSASNEIQTANEIEAGPGGLVMGRFTAAIVEGIASGLADDDRDGRVRLGELVRYVKATVKGQTPQWLMSNARGDPLISLSPLGERPDAEEGGERGPSGHRCLEYSSDAEQSAFATWTPFTRMLFPGAPTQISTDIVQGRKCYSLRSSGSEVVGSNKIIELSEGTISFEYRIASRSGENCNIFVIPIRYGDHVSPGRQGSGSEICDEDGRRTFRIRAALDSGDGDGWSKSTVPFDFNRLGQNVFAILAPRINELSPEQGPGHLLIARVRIFSHGRLDV